MTILAGLAGTYLGAILNIEGYLGIVFAIASMGGFLLKGLEDRK